MKYKNLSSKIEEIKQKQRKIKKKSYNVPKFY